MATNFNDLGFNQQLVNKFLHDRTVIKDVAKIKAFHAQTTSSGTQYYATARWWEDPTLSTGYIVPAGKKLVIFGVRSTNNGNTGGQIHLGTVESDVGFNSSSTGTNARFVQVGELPAAYGPHDFSVFTEVPAGLYLFFAGVPNSASIYATIYGFEIDTDATSI